MSEYKPGDSVLIRAEVIEYIDGVGANVELFSTTDQYRAWVRPDLLQPKGSVVLDLYAIEKTEIILSHLRGECVRPKECPWLHALADQIEAQTKPPRIPEPGLWGVVEAACICDHERVGWVLNGIRWIDQNGDAHEWDNLIDPTLIREGLS